MPYIKTSTHSNAAALLSPAVSETLYANAFYNPNEDTIQFMKCTYARPVWMPHWKEQTCSHALRCQYLNLILALKDVGEHTTALMIVIRTKVHEASYNAMGSFEAPMQIHPSKRYLQFPFVLKVGQLFAAKQKHY